MGHEKQTGSSENRVSHCGKHSGFRSVVLGPAVLGSPLNLRELQTHRFGFRFWGPSVSTSRPADAACCESLRTTELHTKTKWYKQTIRCLRLKDRSFVGTVNIFG